MAKFNKKAVAPQVALKGQKNAPGAVKNHERAKAWKLSPEMALYTRVCTSILQDQFYSSAENELQRTRDLLKQVDPMFVAQLAVYARENMYLRSIPLVLAVELAKIHKGDDLVRRMVRRVIARADELTEVLSYYVVANARERNPKITEGQIKQLHKLSKQLAKGIADAFNKFDAYQLKKYIGEKNDIKMKDVIRLVHPAPKDKEQSEIFRKILAGELETVDTWEAGAANVGQKVAARAAEMNLNDAQKEALKAQEMKALWESKIDTRGKGELGYMAMLRNLMNFLKYGVSTNHLAMVCKRLSDPNEVARSKQLPFRFLTAYRMLMGEAKVDWYKRRMRGRQRAHGNIQYHGDLNLDQGHGVNDPRIGMLLDALEEAALHACKNVPAFDYDSAVLIAADTSGSMQSPISVNRDARGRVINESLLQNYDIGLMLAMMLQHKCKVVTAGMFGDVFAIYNFPKNQILRNANAMHSLEGEVGYSTNGYLVIDAAIKAAEAGKVLYDKIFIFSDGQFWNSKPGYEYNDRGDWENADKSWKRFKAINPNAKLYVFDLAGYGTTPVNMNDGDVFFISGWSDRIFEMLEAIENGGDALEVIKSIKL